MWDHLGKREKLEIRLTKCLIPTPPSPKNVVFVPMAKKNPVLKTGLSNDKKIKRGPYLNL